ncbi:MAG: hypothetical protein L6262_05925 [Weeksellaceae bacterium]|nr:hypothetical protein [Weeksellaceae bacterium]
MRSIRFLFCTALLLSICNCKPQISTRETSLAASNMVTIGLEKPVKIPNSIVSLRFKDILEDSRCPVGVTCVWEGLAIVNMDAVSGDEKSGFQVGTRDFVPKNVKKSFSFSGYRFTLTALKPQPGGKAQAASVTFKYEKEN